MKVKLSKIAIHQTSKVLALVQTVFFAFVFIPFAIFFFVMGEVAGGAVALFYLLGMALFLYVVFALTFWVYNLVASSFGGIEFILSEENKSE